MRSVCSLLVLAGTLFAQDAEAPPRFDRLLRLERQNWAPAADRSGQLWLDAGSVRTAYQADGEAFVFSLDKVPHAVRKDTLPGTDASGQGRHSGIRQAFELAVAGNSDLGLLVQDGVIAQAELHVATVPESNEYFMIHAGVVNSRPYEFVRGDGPTFTLKDGRPSSTAGYVEAYLRRRRAWVDDDVNVDTEVRLGFSFADSGGDDGGTVVSKTAVATGDFYADIEFALSSFSLKFGEQSRGAPQRARGYIAPAVHAGWTTDSEFQHMHGYYGAGFSGCAAFPMPEAVSAGNGNQARAREVELAMGLFGGIAEFPDFANDVGREIRVQHGSPYFTRVPAILLDLQVNIPFGENRYFVMSGNFLDRMDRPFNEATWSLMIGISIPIGEIADAIF